MSSRTRTRRLPRPAAIVALALTCISLAGCGAGTLPQALGNAGRHAASSSLNMLLDVLTPGLAIPCAGRQGEHGFGERQAKACLTRAGTDYVHGVRQGVGGR
jgi:hypothetical protein